MNICQSASYMAFSVLNYKSFYTHNLDHVFLVKSYSKYDHIIIVSLCIGAPQLPAHFENENDVGQISVG